jgi:hypothetical protein
MLRYKYDKLPREGGVEDGNTPELRTGVQKKNKVFRKDPCTGSQYENLTRFASPEARFYLHYIYIMKGIRVFLKHVYNLKRCALKVINVEFVAKLASSKPLSVVRRHKRITPKTRSG